MLVNIVSAGLENRLEFAHLQVDRGPFRAPYARTLILCEVHSEGSGPGSLAPIEDPNKLAEVLPAICSVDTGESRKGKIRIVNVTVNFVSSHSIEGDAAYQESEISGDTMASYRAPTDDLVEKYADELASDLELSSATGV